MELVRRPETEFGVSETVGSGEVVMHPVRQRACAHQRVTRAVLKVTALTRLEDESARMQSGLPL